MLLFAEVTITRYQLPITPLNAKRNYILSPNVSAYNWHRQLQTLGHVLLRLPNNLFCSASLWSYTKYDSNLLCEIASEFCLPQLLKYLYHFIEKTERVCWIFLYDGVCLSPILCYYMCDKFFRRCFVANPGDTTAACTNAHIIYHIQYNVSEISTLILGILNRQSRAEQNKIDG